jgi:uncharacterized membrane protein required for colicin V production
MSIIDSVIIIFLLLGAVLGFKRGVIKSIVSLVGTILVVVLSFKLKDTFATFLYSHLPFFNIGISALNVLIYEVIAFLIIFAILMSILKILIKISGLIELILKFTVILSIPSKILGAIFGFIEYYIFTFIILFLIAQLNIESSLITESKLANAIMENTPIMSNTIKDTYNGINELITMNKNNQNVNDKNELNEEALNIMLKYNIISKENINKLINSGKITEVSLSD